MKHFIDIELPAHQNADGFDHAAFSVKHSLLYIAHTANDALDIVDCMSNNYLGSIEGLSGVAGALVSDQAGLVFTSNRAEDTVGIFKLGEVGNVLKIPVGSKPNGLAFDAGRGLLYAANVGESPLLDAHSVTVVDIEKCKAIHEIPVPGRTRWAIYDPRDDLLYVNIRHPVCIAVIDGGNPKRVARTIPLPAIGPHGLDLDPVTGLLFCACDDSRLLIIDPRRNEILNHLPLSGAPDVIFVDTVIRRLFVASGEPGSIDVIDIDTQRLVEVIQTDTGAHTIGFDSLRHRILALLPASHIVRVFETGCGETVCL